MNLVTVEQPPPSALFDLIAEHGATTSVNRAHGLVAITLAGVAYTFYVYPVRGEDETRLEVSLERYTVAAPPLLFEEIQVRDPDLRPFPVIGDAARRIADRQRLFGRCDPCQNERHASCAHPDPQDHRCWCVCDDDWASGRMTSARVLAEWMDSETQPTA